MMHCSSADTEVYETIEICVPVVEDYDEERENDVHHEHAVEHDENGAQYSRRELDVIVETKVVVQQQQH